MQGHVQTARQPKDQLAYFSCFRKSVLPPTPLAAHGYSCLNSLIDLGNMSRGRMGPRESLAGRLRQLCWVWVWASHVSAVSVRPRASQTALSAVWQLSCFALRRKLCACIAALSTPEGADSSCLVAGLNYEVVGLRQILLDAVCSECMRTSRTGSRARSSQAAAPGRPAAGKHRFCTHACLDVRDTTPPTHRQTYLVACALLRERGSRARKKQRFARVSRMPRQRPQF